MINNTSLINGDFGSAPSLQMLNNFLLICLIFLIIALIIKILFYFYKKPINK